MASVKIDKPKVKRWMQQHVEDHVDRKTDEVNTTSLAEEAANEFDIYENKQDYKIPEEIFDLAVDVGEAWERKNKMASYSYDRTARYEGTPEALFKQMKDSVEGLIETRVKIRKLHEWLGQMANDASGIGFKDVYDDKDVRSVSKELYELDQTIGNAFRNIESLEKDLKKKVV